MNHEACVIIFVRTPEKGTVKTRLSAVLDEYAILELYRRFVLDLLRTLSQGAFDVHICFYPAAAGKSIRRWLGGRYVYTAQKGDDLGERLKAAFLKAFADGFRKVVIIGSDSPDLPGELLKEALDSLDKEDAVIGPALDGGYYLIGFRAGRLLQEVFVGIEWGTPTVYTSTMGVFKEHCYDVHVLPGWRDIDTYEDIRAFMREHHETPSGHLLTLDYLRTHKEIAP
jgi:rSAM/selenodomain-associated transferase 1